MPIEFQCPNISSGTILYLPRDQIQRNIAKRVKKNKFQNTQFLRRSLVLEKSLKGVFRHIGSTGDINEMKTPTSNFRHFFAQTLRGKIRFLVDPRTAAVSRYQTTENNKYETQNVSETPECFKCGLVISLGGRNCKRIWQDVHSGCLRA